MSLRDLSLNDEHAKNGVAFMDWLGVRVPEHFGDPCAEYECALERVGLVDRSYRGVVEVCGPEVLSFLQRTISSETENLGIGEGQPSAFLNAKGKLVGHFWTYRVAEDRCNLHFLEPLRDGFVKQLQKYAFLSDIEVRDAELAVVEVCGPQSSELVETALGVDPSTLLPSRRSLHRYGDVELALYRSSSGIEVQLSRKALGDFWSALSVATGNLGGAVVGQGAAEILRVEAGVPVYGLDYDSNHFPAEAGLENALSYAKCYVGQEIVARMKTYGHANRTLYGLRFPEGALPPAGTMLTREGRDFGLLTSPVLSPRFGSIALCMVARRFCPAKESSAEMVTMGVETAGQKVDIGLFGLPFSGRSGRGSKSG